MDIPDLVQRTLGGEEIQASVSLGDEDVVCLTPTRTLVYKGEGLLSDEQVEEFPHEVERVAVSEGRRKTKFLLEYVEGTRSFTVPSSRGDDVLAVLLEGVLRVASLLDDGESLVGVYRFSELTLILAQGRLIKLIGEQVWNDDFEVYEYDDVTGLEFERASVATSIVLGIDGRPQRVKVPNDQAPVVRQDIERALCEYYDVGSVEALNRLVAPEDDEESSDDHGGIDFGAGIDPLVTDDEPDIAETTEGALDDISTDTATAGPTDNAPPAGEPTPADAADESGPEPTVDAGETRAGPTGSDDGGNDTAGDSAHDDTGTDDDTGPSSPQVDAGSDVGRGGAPESTGEDTAPGPDPTDPTSGGASRETDPGEAATETASEEPKAPADAASGDRAATREQVPAGVEVARREDLATVSDRIGELTAAVERQNELLKRQHRAIKQLVDELQAK